MGFKVIKLQLEMANVSDLLETAVFIVFQGNVAAFCTHFPLDDKKKKRTMRTLCDGRFVCYCRIYCSKCRSRASHTYNTTQGSIILSAGFRYLVFATSVAGPQSKNGGWKQMRYLWGSPFFVNCMQFSAHQHNFKDLIGKTGIFISFFCRGVRISMTPSPIQFITCVSASSAFRVFSASSKWRQNATYSIRFLLQYDAATRSAYCPCRSTIFTRAVCHKRKRFRKTRLRKGHVFEADAFIRQMAGVWLKSRIVCSLNMDAALLRCACVALASRLNHARVTPASRLRHTCITPASHLRHARISPASRSRHA